MSRIPDGYVTVKDRVAKFRKEYPGGKILTSKDLSWEKEAVVFQAEVFDGEGKLLGMGHACCPDLGEDKGLEKAETAAIGRALEFAGYEAVDGDFEPEKEEAPARSSGFGSRPKTQPAAPAKTSAFGGSKPASKPVALTAPPKEEPTEAPETAVEAEVSEVTSEEAPAPTNVSSKLAEMKKKFNPSGVSNGLAALRR